MRLPNAGALGALTVRALPPLRPKDRFARTRLYLQYFSNRSPPRDYINSCGISAQFLSTYHSVRLHISFAFMGKRTDYFFRAGARMEPHQFGQLFCTRDRAREAPFAFLYQPPSVGSLDQSLECDPDFFCSHFFEQAPIRSPSGK